MPDIVMEARAVYELMVHNGRTIKMFFQSPYSGVTIPSGYNNRDVFDEYMRNLDRSKA
jgi:hypothetical protein